MACITKVSRVGGPSGRVLSDRRRHAERVEGLTSSTAGRMVKHVTWSASGIFSAAAVALVHGVMPTVPNGDFERDTAGDGKPDGWMGRGKGDAWDIDHIHLDRGGPSGLRCLCVEASDDPAKFVRAYNVQGAIRPGTKYRLSDWIKRADPRGEVCIRFSGLGQQLLRTTATGRWVYLEAVVTSGPKAGPNVVSCFNSSRGPAWFDQIKVEETNSSRW
jgi:hypothetical protein